MSKIDRKTQLIFGGNSSQNGQFGSANAGTFILNNDPDVIQGLPAWGSGWNSATISGEKLPALEEVQGIHYVETRQIAYLFQEGIPEYDLDTEYHENSIVKESGTVKLYKSLTDNNEGNPLSDSLNWSMVVDLDSISAKNNYTATTNPTVNDDSSQGYSAGSVWYNTSTQEAYLCTDPANGSAIWILITLTVENLGSAAFVNTGIGSGDVPLNSNLGSAAYLPVGTTIGNVVQVANVGGNPGLPAIDGSQLKNIPVKVYSATPTAANTHPITGIFRPGYNYKFVLSGIGTSVDASSLRIVLSQDNGSTYISSYRYVFTAMTDSAATVSGGANTGAAEIIISGSAGNDIGEDVNLTLYLYNPAMVDANRKCALEWGATNINNSGNSQFFRGTSYSNTAGSVNAVRFQWNNSSNFKTSGSITIYEEPI